VSSVPLWGAVGNCRKLSEMLCLWRKLGFTDVSSPTLSLLTVVQAEVLRQEQDGHDTEPNFFQGIHQVRMTTYLIPFFLTLFITAFSNFSTTTSTAPWASQKTQARYDENPSFTCTIYHSTASCRDYHFQNPPTTSIHPATPSCNAARRRCFICEG